jgi:hypothetical protein
MVMMSKEPSSPPYSLANTSKRQRIVAYIILSVLIMAVLSFAGFIVVSISAAAPEFLLIVVEAVVLLFGVFTVSVLYRRVFIISMAFAIALTVSFVFGFGTGRAYLSDSDVPNIVVSSVAGDAIKLKSGETLSGRIIRSGERGVLFYDPVSRRLHFLLWAAIGSIDASPQTTTVGR